MSYDGKFAKYYDYIYETKDYQEEVNYILNMYQKLCIKDDINLLDIGCGTGNHLKYFMNKDFVNCVALEPSKEMFLIAKNKIKNNIILNNTVEKFYCFNKNNKFDLITSLFHVINAICDKENLESFISSTSNLLNKGGIYFFDIWNKEAVLYESPRYLNKSHFCKDETHVNVKCNPFIVDNDKVVLDMNICISSMNEFCDIFEHKLEVKLWDREELKNILCRNGLETLKETKAFSDEEYSNNHYKISFVCRKK